MTHGLQLFDQSGNITFDSRSVVGGVVVDILTYAGATTAVRNYPAFAGRTMQIIMVTPWFNGGDPGVAIDTSPGYPRLLVSTTNASRRFMLVVF